MPKSINTTKTKKPTGVNISLTPSFTPLNISANGLIMLKRKINPRKSVITFQFNVIHSITLIMITTLT